MIYAPFPQKYSKQNPVTFDSKISTRPDMKGWTILFYISVQFELILLYLLAKQSFSSVNVSFQNAVTTFNDFNKPECVFIMSAVMFI